MPSGLVRAERAHERTCTAMIPALARRGFAIGRATQRATTLARCGAGAVTLVVTLACAWQSTHPRVMCTFGATREEVARMTVMKYALEAMPSWLSTHPGRACPDHLADLNDWMNNRDTVDPWGRDYRWACRHLGAPQLLFVASAGPDGRFGTSDDIGSDP